jgi:2-amino-4-hydroxy-6-hydroxymethyldihydropteridine diphosphokinase
MTQVVFIGLGSNLSEPRQQLQEAVKHLAVLPATTLLSISSLYQSRPMGPQDQPDYLNAVACLETELEPEALLDQLQAIEADQGRLRDGQRWGARTLDLDILLYGALSMNTSRLIIPHPGTHEREFVLLPLKEIAPDLDIPGQGLVSELAERCDPNGIFRVGELH